MFLPFPHTVHKMAARGTAHTLRRLVQIQPERGKAPYFREVEYSAVDQRYTGKHFYRKTATITILSYHEAGTLSSAAGSFYDATENHVLVVKWQRASLAKMEDYHEIKYLKRNQGADHPRRLHHAGSR